VKGYPLLNQP